MIPGYPRLSKRSTKMSLSKTDYCSYWKPLVKKKIQTLVWPPIRKHAIGLRSFLCLCFGLGMETEAKLDLPITFFETEPKHLQSPCFGAYPPPKPPRVQPHLTRHRGTALQPPELHRSLCSACGDGDCGDCGAAVRRAQRARRGAPGRSFKAPTSRYLVSAS